MTVTMGSRYCKSLTTAVIYAPFPDSSLYKCDSSSTFLLIPVGTIVVTGAATKIRKRWDVRK